MSIYGILSFVSIISFIVIVALLSVAVANLIVPRRNLDLENIEHEYRKSYCIFRIFIIALISFLISIIGSMMFDW